MYWQRINHGLLWQLFEMWSVYWDLAYKRRDKSMQVSKVNVSLPDSPTLLQCFRLLVACQWHYGSILCPYNIFTLSHLHFWSSASVGALAILYHPSQLTYREIMIIDGDGIDDGISCRARAASTCINECSTSSAKKIRSEKSGTSRL